MSTPVLGKGLLRCAPCRFYQTFNRFVEVGRVAWVAFGADKGKVVVIVDIVDQSRALVDGPVGVTRKALNMKQLHLTNIVINMPGSCRTGVVRKAWEKAEVDKRFAESTWAKKIAARQKRATLGDFDRFKLMKAKQSRNRILAAHCGTLAKTMKPKARRINKTLHKK